jgi:hypothetical protein
MPARRRRGHIFGLHLPGARPALELLASATRLTDRGNVSRKGSLRENVMFRNEENRSRIGDAEGPYSAPWKAMDGQGLAARRASWAWKSGPAEAHYL